MKPDMRSRGNLGKRVALAAEPHVIGEVTLDLRHQAQHPPLAHISLYVRWVQPAPYYPGAWFGAAGLPLADLIPVSA